MKKIHAGSFKTQCLKLMKQVHATGEPVLVTRHGVPLVKVVPADTPSGDLFGFMKDEFAITGDIESPVLPASRWKTLKK